MEDDVLLLLPTRIIFNSIFAWIYYFRLLSYNRVSADALESVPRCHRFYGRTRQQWERAWRAMRKQRQNTNREAENQN